MRIKPIAALSGTAALAGAAVAVGITPAAGSYEECPDGRFCMWQDREYGAAGFTTRTVSDSTFNGNTFNNGVGLNDEVSSARNRTPFWVKLHQNSDYGGHDLCFAPGAAHEDLRDFTYVTVPLTFYESFNDKASSVSVYTSGATPASCDWTVSAK